MIYIGPDTYSTDWSVLGRAFLRPTSVLMGMMKSPVLRSTSFLSSSLTLQKAVKRYHRRHHHFRRSDRLRDLQLRWLGISDPLKGYQGVALMYWRFWRMLGEAPMLVNETE